MLLCASSPYAQSGALHDAYRRYYGHDDASVLVWRAPTRTMNSTFPQETIDAAIERDPASAASEYLAEFRTDVAAFVTREAVEKCVSRGIHERAYIEGVSYIAFVDPSGGSSDSMTLAIAHKERDIAVVDAIRERRSPFSPDDCVSEFADVLRSYRIGTVRGDRYGGSWPAERFQKHGIEYRPSDFVKSDIYLGSLSALNSARCDLLDHPRLIAQLIGLERRAGRGKDLIDHRPGSHDDVANAVAGAVWELVRQPEPRKSFPAPIIWHGPAVGDLMSYGDATNPAAAPLHVRQSWAVY
jgi:hypothetical protein